MHRTTRVLALSAAAAAAAITLAACGSSDTAGSSGPDMDSMGSSSTMPKASSPAPTGTAAPAAGPHNAADVAFSTGMIPHHAQAVEMADLALAQATNADVKLLATEIKAAQDPEIQMMSGWLTEWGEAVPDTSMPGMDHGAGEMDMGGMMTEQEMADLEQATGAAFDRMWLEMMTRHHEGAVTMAETELADGSNGEAKALAQEIITSQTAEITQMEQLATAVG